MTEPRDAGTPNEAGSGEAVGTSLWLVPQDGELARRLSDWVNSLAGSFGTSPFRPHLTLLSGLEGPEGEIVRQSTALAQALPHLELRLSGIDGSDDYFRCVFARVEPAPELVLARERALELFGRHRETPFTPHISLMYGRLAPETKAAMIRGLGECLAGALVSRELRVMRTQGPPDRWESLASLALGMR